MLPLANVVRGDYVKPPSPYNHNFPQFMNFMGLQEPLANANNLNELLAHLQQLDQFNANDINAGMIEADDG
jgi:hypothetical protein